MILVQKRNFASRCDASGTRKMNKFRRGLDRKTGCNVTWPWLDARHSVDSTASFVRGISEDQPAFKNKESQQAPADSENVHAKATSTMWPTTENIESPSSSRLLMRLPYSRGKRYVKTAIFIAASPGDLHWGHAPWARRSSQRELGRALVTNLPFSGLTETFRVWYCRRSSQLWSSCQPARKWTQKQGRVYCWQQLTCKDWWRHRTPRTLTVCCSCLQNV
jgi:hypothetical protein